MKKTTADRANFKINIHKALFASADIRDLILGDTSGLSQIQLVAKFKKHVKSHLFVDDTIEESATFIFYDIIMPNLHEHTKTCEVHMYLITHRDILETYTCDGYYGDRIDILTQMVEDALINDEDTAQKFGIGKLTLDSILFYNSLRFYGAHLIFSVPTYR